MNRGSTFGSRGSWTLESAWSCFWVSVQERRPNGTLHGNVKEPVRGGGGGGLESDEASLLGTMSDERGKDHRGSQRFMER